MRATSAKLTVGSLRELSAIGVVSAMAAAYGAALLGASGILDAISKHRGGSTGVMLTVVSGVFIAIALFVSAIVIGNGVDTVIAGRTRQLTLLRLVGASSAQLRASLVRAVAAVSAIGTGIGLVLGIVLTTVTRMVLVSRGTLDDLNYPTVTPSMALAAVAVIGTAVGATLVSAGRALNSSTVIRAPGSPRSTMRLVISLGLLGGGGLLLAIAALLGERASLGGFGFAFLGSATVSVGVLLGAHYIVPATVSAVSRLAGNGPAAMVARKNAISDPRRTTRSTIGLLIGVTLVTTVASGMDALTAAIRSQDQLSPADIEDATRLMNQISAILIGMIAISVVIAAVGFLSTMSLTVIGRTREIGMLRAMGFTGRQVRSMITLESVSLSGAAVLFGLALGLIFGAVGSQSLIGSMTSGFALGMPWPVFVAIIAGTALLVLASSLPPSRRAVAVAPVDALAVA